MNDHTPGPWVYFENEDSPFWGQIRSTETFELIAHQPESDDRHDDFVLMASAPEMLKVLHSLHEWLSSSDWGDWSYMEGSEIYDDTRKHLAAISAVIPNLSEANE